MFFLSIIQTNGINIVTNPYSTVTFGIFDLSSVSECSNDFIGDGKVVGFCYVSPIWIVLSGTDIFMYSVL